MKSNNTNLLRKAEKVVLLPREKKYPFVPSPGEIFSSECQVTKHLKRISERFQNNMGKIRRARQKLHLPAVKPDNEKDKQDVMKPNEVCQTCPL